ncbi:MAG: envelope stress response membrane protein PspB [Cellvibrionaceae bacterium]
MDGGELTGLVAVVMIFSIPLFAIWAGILKARYQASQRDISDGEREQLQRLTSVADSMVERIATLEAILDAEVPDWRDDHESER